MGKIIKITSLFFLLFIIGSCSEDSIIDVKEELTNENLEKIYQEELNRKSFPEPVQASKLNPKKVYVHYMPWFASLETDGFWGQHWTMTNRNPNNVDVLGKREIASHYYPLIGPYSSKDNDLQEYHLLLMKLSGIDGVIFDWYGARNVNDFDMLKTNTNSFINEIEQVGLKFAIMYEDRSAQFLQKNHLAPSNIDAAVTDLQYIENNYFTSNNYLKINGSEMLFLFGPEYITEPSDWDYILSQMNTNPRLMSLWKASSRLGNNAGGEFSWVDRNHLMTLNGYYQYTAQNNIQTVGGAYPGFNDYYLEGGWRNDPSLDWEIPHNGLKNFNETLALADNFSTEFMQLITWNDFGEGTMIEPTLEFGFSFLESIQAYTGVSYTATDLELPLKLYQLRKKYKNEGRLQVILNRVYYLIFTLELNKAKRLLAIIERFYPI